MTISLINKLKLLRFSSLINFTSYRKYNREVNQIVYEPLKKKRDGQDPVSYVKQILLKKYDPTSEKTKFIDHESGVKLGDFVRVSYNNKKSVYGTVIQIRRCEKSIGHNILLRSKHDTIGCEIRVPLFNPNVTKLEIIKKLDTVKKERNLKHIRNTDQDVLDIKTYLKKIN